MFYKLKAFHENGIEVTLHTFLYNRPERDELLKYCKRVYYYERRTGIVSQLSVLPYIVFSRRSEKLLEILMKDEAPILFEGLHTTYLLNHPLLVNRFKMVRTHNIEHEYYQALSAKQESFKQKLFHTIETIKLKRYEKILKHANLLITISPDDDRYFSKYEKTFFLPACHSNNSVDVKPGEGKYMLYQGDLSSPENEEVANYLLNALSNDFHFLFIIAGKNPSEKLINTVKSHSHVVLIPNPDEMRMKMLLQDAHIVFVISFQATGMKLKMLNALYNARYIIANNEVLVNKSMAGFCLVANSPVEIEKQVSKCKGRELETENIQAREQYLMKDFDVKTNVKNLIHYLLEI